MNAFKLKASRFYIIISFCFLFQFEGSSQYDPKDYTSFINIIEFDSLAISQLTPSKAKSLYYIKDALENKPKPLVKMHCRTNSSKGNRLDNQFSEIAEMALPLGLNSITVDSSKIKGVLCEYWISLYRMKIDQIHINEKIVADNLICVLGKFDDNYKKGKAFKINGRKVQLMPYEYVQRTIAKGKRGSVKINGQRAELIGGENGGEAFFHAVPQSNFNSPMYINLGSNFGALGLFISIPLNSKKKIKGLKRNFSYFLYNIYKEKVVVAKTREALIAAKKKEWREKQAAEEAKKKAKEEKKKKG